MYAHIYIPVYRGRECPLQQWVPTFSAPGTSFMEDNFPWTERSGEWFRDDSRALHLLCTLFLLFIFIYITLYTLFLLLIFISITLIYNEIIIQLTIM